MAWSFGMIYDVFLSLLCMCKRSFLSNRVTTCGPVGLLIPTPGLSNDTLS